MDESPHESPGAAAVPAAPHLLGIDVGGTKTAVVRGDANGSILARIEFPTAPSRPFHEVYSDIVDRVRQLRDADPGIAAIGVSIGGPLDSQRGIILSPPNLPGWDAIPLRDLLARDFRIPVRILHDAKAGALAEWRFGAGQGCRSMVFLTFGTGLGCGVVCDGRLLETIPGEVGHWGIGLENGPLIYGRTDAWEGVSSGAGIAALAHSRYPETFSAATTARDIIDAARAIGDSAIKARAIDVLDTAAEYLGRGIALLVDLLGPERVVLGSLAIRAGDLILPRCRAAFERNVHPRLRDVCRIVPAALADRLGDVASLCAAQLAREDEGTH